MAIRLISLSGVSSEEADEIRYLLCDKNINFYETPAGNFGLPMNAIWLKDESQFPTAKKLLDEYHADRFVKVKSDQILNDVNDEHKILRCCIYISFFIVFIISIVVLVKSL